MRTLEQMKANAQRHLDGMTNHRDQMANDVIWLANTVRRLENLIKELPATPPAGGFSSAFDEIFRKGGLKP